jgi:hypothetical protein
VGGMEKDINRGTLLKYNSVYRKYNTKSMKMCLYYKRILQMLHKDVEKLGKYMQIKPKYLKFLEYYESSLDFNGSAKRAGIEPANVMKSIQNNTHFGKLYTQLMELIDKDPRVNKVGSIHMLLDLKERAKEAGKCELELKIIQEINKMIAGNIAATRKEVKTETYNVKGVIDLTKPKKEPKTIDIPHESIELAQIEDGD